MDPKIDTQQSYEHETTGDASAHPLADGDEATTRAAGSAPGPSAENKIRPEPPAGLIIERDETDDGGPLVIKSSDPDLNPPRAPVDPFPTLGKPEEGQAL